MTKKGWLGGVVLGLLLGTVLSVTVSAQPYAAQITRALNGFLTVAHSWTAAQTFTDITISGTCTGCDTGFPLLAPNGTAGAPSYSWANSPTTGEYRIGADNIGFSAGGTLRWDYSTVRILSTIPLLFTDNTVDIGAAGATRPRTGYFGTSVLSPLITTRVVTSGAVPAVSNTSANSCGTDAATLDGNENNGVITVGATAGSSCTITFATAAPTRRECTANNETTGNLTRAIYLTTTTTKIDGTFVAADKLSYVCFAR